MYPEANLTRRFVALSATGPGQKSSPVNNVGQRFKPTSVRKGNFVLCLALANGGLSTSRVVSTRGTKVKFDMVLGKSIGLSFSPTTPPRMPRDTSWSIGWWPKNAWEDSLPLMRLFITSTPTLWITAPKTYICSSRESMTALKPIRDGETHKICSFQISYNLYGC